MDHDNDRSNEIERNFQESRKVAIDGFNRRYGTGLSVADFDHAIENFERMAMGAKEPNPDLGTLETGGHAPSSLEGQILHAFLVSLFALGDKRDYAVMCRGFIQAARTFKDHVQSGRQAFTEVLSRATMGGVAVGQGPASRAWTKHVRQWAEEWSEDLAGSEKQAEMMISTFKDFLSDEPPHLANPDGPATRRMGHPRHFRRESFCLLAREALIAAKKTPSGIPKALASLLVATGYFKGRDGRPDSEDALGIVRKALRSLKQAASNGAANPNLNV